MPRDGNYAHHRVGDAPAALTPQHGGVVSNVTTTVHSEMAQGTFTVESGGIFFTGNVSASHCSSHR